MTDELWAVVVSYNASMETGVDAEKYSEKEIDAFWDLVEANCDHVRPDGTTLYTRASCRDVYCSLCGDVYCSLCGADCEEGDVDYPVDIA